MGLPHRHLLVALVSLALIYVPIALGDTSIANLSVMGIVPAYFSVASTGQPGDLDLTPKAVVANRTIGNLHFKFNENIVSLTVSSSTNSGAPEDSGGNPYSFGPGGFKISFRAGCATVDPTYVAPFALTNVGVDVKSALASALVSQGIEEDCEILATYTGTTTALPLAGRYSMNVVLTMVSP